MVWCDTQAMLHCTHTKLTCVAYIASTTHPPPNSYQSYRGWDEKYGDLTILLVNKRLDQNN